MKKLLIRAWHGVNGHPWGQIQWGDARKGASCQCGDHWGPGDILR